MQKGSLDRDDYIRLGLLVLVYFILRPYIEKLFQAGFGSREIEEGEQILQEYTQGKAKLDGNALRSSKSSALDTAAVTGEGAVTTGSKASKSGETVNRKVKFKVDQAEKSAQEKLIDWDGEPARKPVEGDMSDVTNWLDRWDE